MQLTKLTKIEGRKQILGAEVREIEKHKGYYVTEHGYILSCRPLNGIGPNLSFQKARVMQKQKTPNGYEIVMLDRKSTSVHKIVLEAFKGKCPKGKMAGHKNSIRTDNCISNLYWATWAEQWEDKETAGTYQRGELVGTSKLDDNKVRCIRKMHIKYNKEYGATSLGKMFGVHVTTIIDVVNRETWGHVK